VAQSRSKLRWTSTACLPVLKALCAPIEMIYVEEKDFDRQIDLLGFLAEQDEYLICAWLYPESKEISIASQTVTETDLEPVTTYGDGTKPKHTELSPCTPEILKTLLSEKSTIEKNIDSLAIYKLGEKSWSAVTIGHEGMCLVRSLAYLQSLEAAGFIVSTEAPSWW